MIEEFQCQLIRDTFAKAVDAGSNQVGRLFCQRLFAAAPELRGLFGEAALMEMLELAVSGLARWPQLVKDTEGLGARHSTVGSDDFTAIGVALIDTLREVLDGDWTEAAEEAWRDFYTDLSLVAERGARRKGTLK